MAAAPAPHEVIKTQDTACRGVHAPSLAASGCAARSRPEVSDHEMCTKHAVLTCQAMLLHSSSTSPASRFRSPGDFAPCHWLKSVCAFTRLSWMSAFTSSKGSAACCPGMVPAAVVTPAPLNVCRVCHAAIGMARWARVRLGRCLAALTML